MLNNVTDRRAGGVSPLRQAQSSPPQGANAPRSPGNRLAADLDHVLAHTADLWDELRGQRLFITGATGFFGCWLLESFCWANDHLDLGAEATILTRRQEVFDAKAPHLARHPAIRMVQGDVRACAFPSGQFPYVIHAATESGTTQNNDDPLAMLDTVVGGTRRVLDFARQAGARKFLLTSSGAVYGRQPPTLAHVGEDYLGGPDYNDARSAYAEGKRLAELLCNLYLNRFGLETKIARCFAFVGPHLPLDAHFAIGNFLRDALAGRPIQISGDGTPLRSYLHAADLMIWLWTVLLKGQTGRPYNVGSEAAVSIADLARQIGERYAVPVHIAKRPAPGHAAERYVPNTQRAREELGLRTWIDLEDAIARTALFHREQ